MVKSNNQINKEAGNGPGVEDTPAVLAYRMGQVEIAVKESSKTVIEGFKEHDKKLTDLTSNFATKEELAIIQGRLNDYQWYFRALVTAVLFALGTAIGSLFFKK
jgi:hypothetical protein